MEVAQKETLPWHTSLTAVVSALVALAPAFLQLFSSERRYEVILLSIAAFMGVLVWVQNKRAMEHLRQMLEEMKEEHQKCRTDVAALQALANNRTGHLNATVNNLYRDLVRLAGRRGIGVLSFEEESGTYSYRPAADRTARKGRDRRKT